MKKYKFIVNKVNTNSVNNLMDFLFEDKKLIIPFKIYSEQQTNDRNLPKGLVAIYNDSNNIINEQINCDIEFNTNQGKKYFGEIENNYPKEFLFYGIKIKQVYKIKPCYYGYFIIFEDNTAIHISNGSGMRYIGCLIGNIIEEKT